jgi:hypothetical protein
MVTDGMVGLREQSARKGSGLEVAVYEKPAQRIARLQPVRDSPATKRRTNTSACRNLSRSPEAARRIAAARRRRWT